MARRVEYIDDEIPPEAFDAHPGQGWSTTRSKPPARRDAGPNPPPTRDIDPPPDLSHVMDLIDPDAPHSSAIDLAIEGLLLSVIDQIQREFQVGTSKQRSAIARMFMPKIMAMAERSSDGTSDELATLRAEMDRLNAEMFNTDPLAYLPGESHTPDDDNLPTFDPVTGRTIERDVTE